MGTLRERISEIEKSTTAIKELSDKIEPFIRTLKSPPGSQEEITEYKDYLEEIIARLALTDQRIMEEANEAWRQIGQGGGSAVYNLHERLPLVHSWLRGQIAVYLREIEEQNKVQGRLEDELRKLEIEWDTIEYGVASVRLTKWNIFVSAFVPVLILLLTMAGTILYDALKPESTDFIRHLFGKQSAGATTTAGMPSIQGQAIPIPRR